MTTIGISRLITIRMCREIDRLSCYLKNLRQHAANLGAQPLTVAPTPTLVVLPRTRFTSLGAFRQILFRRIPSRTREGRQEMRRRLMAWASWIRVILCDLRQDRRDDRSIIRLQQRLVGEDVAGDHPLPAKNQNPSLTLSERYKGQQGVHTSFLRIKDILITLGPMAKL